MKKCTKKILLVGLATILAGMLVSCDGLIKKEPKQEPIVKDGLKNPYEGEDVLGTVSANLLDDGDADETEGEIYFSNYGVTQTKVDGGVEGQAWKVVQTEEEWSELGIDLTSVYGQGKSYLISAKVKNDPENTAHKDAMFTVAWTLYSGDVKNWADAISGTEYYDYNESDPSIVSPWGGALDTEGTAYGYSEDDFNVPTELTDEWQEISYIINSTAIEEKVNNSGVYKFSIAFYAGKDGPAGYSFLIDDISIKDLNSELKRNGMTWVDPNAEEEAEEPEETEEEEE